MEDKEFNPLKLESGEEIYNYLKDKSKEEVKEYFVQRGAVIRNGIMFNNGLYLLYRLEKEKHENPERNKSYTTLTNNGEISR